MAYFLIRGCYFLWVTDDYPKVPHLPQAQGRVGPRSSCFFIVSCSYFMDATAFFFFPEDIEGVFGLVGFFFNVLFTLYGFPFF